MQQLTLSCNDYGRLERATLQDLRWASESLLLSIVLNGNDVYLVQLCLISI